MCSFICTIYVGSVIEAGLSQQQCLFAALQSKIAFDLNPGRHYRFLIHVSGCPSLNHLSFNSLIRVNGTPFMLANRQFQVSMWSKA